MSKNIVAEFIQNISDDDLRFVSYRLIERMLGDLPEVLNLVGRNKAMDYFFSSAFSGEDLFDRCDQLKEHAQKECQRRNIKLYKSVG